MPLPSLVEETNLSLLYIFGALVEDQVAMYMWIYFWDLYSVSLVYRSVFIPVLHCFDYDSFVICFKTRKCDGTNFVPFQD